MDSFTEKFVGNFMAGVEARNPGEPEFHQACIKYGRNPDGTVDYVKGANIAAFIKVAGAMMDQGLV